MDGLDVDNKLTAAIAENKHANAATTRLESLGQTAVEARLVSHGDTSLDISSLGHGDDGTLLDVQNTVLLEDGTKHGLDNHTGSGVGDERRLLVELLGEQVDTEVTVLASGSRGRDADDLARAALQDQDIAHADVVAGNSDGVGDSSGLREAAGGTLPADLNAVVLVVENFVGHLVKTVTERVVVAWLFWLARRRIATGKMETYPIRRNIPF